MGAPAPHSLPPAMHTAALRALGLDAVYVALPTPADALPPVLAALAVVGAAGDVTGPHKEAGGRIPGPKNGAGAPGGPCNTVLTQPGQVGRAHPHRPRGLAPP